MTTTTTLPTGLVGNLTADPELRTSAAGKPWMRARLSVKPYVAGAETQPETVFYDLVAFGSLAEHVVETCRKGSRIVVSGRIEDSTWTGNDGTEHPGQKIIADAIGPDLRFAGTTSTRPKATEPTPVLDELLGKQAARGYTDEPF
jgi:single-strand DNA-binding protein